MSAADNGGPAFPVVEPNRTTKDGMTLRDYFAAKAMQGFAADATAEWRDGAAGMACQAYKWADAMLKERAK